MTPNPKIIQPLRNAIRHGTLALATLALVASASAAPITWTSAPATVSGSYGQTLNTSLFDSTDVVYAENTGGSAQTFDGISFGAGSIAFSIGESFNGYHEGGWPSQSGAWGWPNERTITLGTGSLPVLTIGQRYKVQVLVYDGRASNFNGTVSFDGINQGVFGHGVDGVTWGNGRLVTGTFTADATTQAFTVHCYNAAGADNGALVNALVLNTLPALTATAPPAFTPPGAGYNAAQSVTLTADSGSTIYYTTDGSDPTTSETRISGDSPLSGIVVPIDMTETIKAYATLTGYTDSAVVSATYHTYTTAPTVVWTNPAGGNWGAATNWTDGFVANGIGITADFSTLTLTDNATVDFDTAATVGNLRFADQGNAYTWNITSGILTLNTIVGTPEINVSNQNVTIDSILAGTQGMTKTGAGTLTLYGVNTYSGGTTINAGTLATANFATLGTGTIHIGSNGAYAFSTTGSSQPTFANTVSGAGAFNVTGSGSNQSFWTGDFSGFSGTLTIGSNAVFWANSSTNTGGTAMKLNVSGAFGLYSGESGITRTCHLGELSGGTASHIYGGDTNTGNVITLSVGALNTSTTFAGVMMNNWATNNNTSTLGLTKTGTGTLTLTGINSCTGATTINAGTLQIGNGGVTGSLTPASTITNNGTLSFHRSDEIIQGVDFSGSAITGTGGLTQIGPGTLTLTTSNTYTGITAVTGGELAVGPAQGTKWNVAQLSMSDGTALAIRNFSSNAGTAPVEATVSLTTAGTVTIKVEGSFAIGTFPLIFYPLGTEIGGAGFDAFVLGTMPEGVTAHLENDAEAASINLVVTAMGTPYSNWASINAPTGTSADDYDGDGVSNGVEWVLGGLATTNDLGKLPKATTSGGNLVFSFDRADQAISADTTVTIEVGTDLGTWTPYIVGTSPEVIITDNGPTDTVTLTVPITSDSKKFARLKVVTAP